MALASATWLVLPVTGAAQDSTGKQPQSQPPPQSKPLFDSYDNYFLSSAKIYGAFLGSTCTQTPSAGSSAGVELHCSRPVSTYLADLQGGMLQFYAERASRRVGERLAAIVQQPLNDSPEAVRAAQNASQECNQGIQRACVDLGYATLKGWGVPRNQQRADLLFRKACASGEPEGCGYLAVGYERNYPKEAADLYGRACFAGQGESPACERLAALNEQGHGIAKDLSLAAALYRRRCEQSNKDTLVCAGWVRLSQQGIQAAEITSRFAPAPALAEPAQPAPATPP
jgi:hypothetical protein